MKLTRATLIQIIKEELKAITESITEAKLTNHDAAAVHKAMLNKSYSFDSVVLNKKNDVLIVNYNKFSDRSKVRKAVTDLGYTYDSDGQSTNAPKGIAGVGETNWMSFTSKSVVKNT